jgi:hypothetical protein
LLSKNKDTSGEKFITNMICRCIPQKFKEVKDMVEEEEEEEEEDW